jgi:hypothetical protein
MTNKYSCNSKRQEPQESQKNQALRSTEGPAPHLIHAGAVLFYLLETDAEGVSHHDVFLNREVFVNDVVLRHKAKEALHFGRGVGLTVEANFSELHSVWCPAS